MARVDLKADCPLESLGYRQCKLLAAAKALSHADFADPETPANTGIPAGADYALLQVLTQAVRYRTDGGTPTAAQGTRIDAGDNLWCNASDLALVEIIEETATAEVNVEYFRAHTRP